MAEIKDPFAERTIETMEEMYVNMGPQHPSTHGVLRLLLKLDGEVILEAIPYIGYLHRCHEKIYENRTYLQIIPYTDRLDYLAAMSNNFSFCLAVERLMGIPVPERAEYIRVIMAELQRIASHLVFVGTFGLDLGNFTIFMYCFRERERIVDLFEMTSGQRLNYTYYRIGGVAMDLPPGFVEDTWAFLEYFKPKLADYDRLFTDNRIFQDRVKRIGILNLKTAVNYGISGPMLRASGKKWDLRRHDPYSIYDRFEFDIPVGEKGDCWDRYIVRMEEMRQSIRILEQALRDLPSGEIQAKVPKTLKPPAGETYSRIEAPRGELGFYIVSDGTTKPYRVKIRAPSFVNLSVAPVILPGCLVADCVAVLGSIDIVLGEVDR